MVRKGKTRKLWAFLMALFLVLGMWTMPGTTAADAADQYSDGYNISTLLSKYQYIVAGDVEMSSAGHTVGAVVVGGTLKLDNTFGDAAIVPSYVNTLERGTFGNAWHGKYPTKSNTVYYKTNASGNNYLDSNVWIQNGDYIDTDTAFAEIKAQSAKLTDGAKGLTPENSYSKVVVDCTGDEDVNVVISYEDFQKGVNIKVESVDWFQSHLCIISVTGANGNNITFDGYSSISVNNNGIGNLLKSMSGSDTEYGSQLNVAGMNLVWNFPDATGNMTVQGLGGHLVAPKADVYFNPGNYEGGVIAKTLSGSAEGHFYPMSLSLPNEKEEEKDLEDAKTADASFSKQATGAGKELSGATLSLIYTGEGDLTKVTQKSGPELIQNKYAILWVSDEAEGQVELEGLPAGEYTLTETAAPDGYSYASSIAFKIADGKIYEKTGEDESGTIIYSTKPSDGKFVMVDEVRTGSVSLQGTLGITNKGGTAPSETYKFIVTENGQQVSKGQVTGAGTIAFDEITYYGDEDLGEHTYTITEVSGSTEDMTYDSKSVTVVVKVTDVKSKEVTDDSGNTTTEAIPTLTVEIESSSDTIAFTNVYEKATTTEATTETTTEATTEATTEKKTEATTEATTEKATEATTEKATEATTEKKPEATTEATTEKKPEATTEKATEATTEKKPEATTEKATEATTEKKPEATTEKATEATTTEKVTEATTTEKATEATTTEKASEATTEANGTKTGSLVAVITDPTTYNKVVPIPNAQVEILDKDGNKVGETLTTDVNGETTAVTGLTIGESYTVHVISVPNRYVLPEDATVEIESANKVTEVTLETKKTGSLKAVITDEKTGDPIPGAKVEILDQDGNKVGETLTTDAKGSTGVVNQLNIAETYTVHVTEVPKGYTAPKDKTGTVLDQDDPIEIQLVVSKSSQTEDPAPAKKTGSLIAVITDPKTYNKVVPIPGAQVEILDKDGNKVGETLTTDINGETTAVTGLTVGETYTVHVISVPNRYVLPEDATVEIKSTDEAARVPLETKKTGSLKAVITDEKTGAPIPGAKVEILDKNGNKVGETLITDANGCTSVVDLLDIAETYTVHVIEVPEGYTAPQDQKGIILDQDDPIEIPLLVSKTAASNSEATTQQETTQQATTENANDTAAETGDSFDGVLAVTLLLLAAAMIGFTAYRKRKNEKE